MAENTRCRDFQVKKSLGQLVQQRLSASQYYACLACGKDVTKLMNRFAVGYAWGRFSTTWEAVGDPQPDRESMIYIYIYIIHIFIYVHVYIISPFWNN